MHCEHIFSVKTKKIIVVSFQRSGTHFLINSLATNFAEIEDGWIDVVHGRENKWVKGVTPQNLKDKIREQILESYYADKSRKCLKTHYQAYFLERYLDQIVEKYDIFYMIRDPRDVMVACYNYYNNTDFERFIKEPDFSKFLRRPLWDVQTETQAFSYSFVKPRNIIDKWTKHVSSWLPYKDKGVTFIRFRDLKLHPERTFHYIASRSGQKLNEEIVQVTVDDKRYRPDFNKAGINRGSIGIWSDYFNRDDINFLEDTIPEWIREIAY
jgi:Sulfotransferase domain